MAASKCMKVDLTVGLSSWLALGMSVGLITLGEHGFGLQLPSIGHVVVDALVLFCEFESMASNTGMSTSIS